MYEKSFIIIQFYNLNGKRDEILFRTHLNLKGEEASKSIILKAFYPNPLLMEVIPDVWHINCIK